ncbi:MAG: HAD-IIIA family hydrolase [Ktedonobacterales bacterium]|nr:HAD-IIIA family hydrolase [Ktedonobacterales bacterium]
MSNITTDHDLIIFDLNGTLVDPRIGAKNKPQFRAHAHDWRIKDGVFEPLRYLRANHVQLAIATNQGGVAFGITEPLDMQHAIMDAAYALGIYIVHFCFDHPDGSKPRWRHESEYRKPAPGMLFRAMTDAHAIPERTLMVGDRDEDREAALHAECQFMTATDFFTALHKQMTQVPQSTVPEEDFPF